MKNRKQGSLALVLCFTLFLALGLGLHLGLGDRAFSENENRYLAQKPKFTWKSLISGDFTAGFEAYITDQFPFRDAWLDLKSRAERFAGKTENNGVFFCSDDTLISRFDAPPEADVSNAAEAVRSLAENTGLPVYLALVPSAAEVWAERLPKNANTADQSALISEIYERCGVSTVDLLGALNAHRDEALYYRTDHHWTTLGAYYGYAATAEALGFTPQPLEAFTPTTVSTDFCGTVYSSSGVRWVEPDVIQTFVDAPDVTLVRYDTPDGILSPVYAEEKLRTKDQYSFFLGGNTSRLTVDTGHDGPKLLILRDSYMDSELPFFFDHASELHVLDLRYFRQSVAEYALEHDFDAILVSYSLSDFVTDASVLLMGS